MEVECPFCGRLVRIEGGKVKRCRCGAWFGPAELHNKVVEKAYRKGFGVAGVYRNGVYSFVVAVDPAGLAYILANLALGLKPLGNPS